MPVTSRQGLIDFCRRSLGEPVVELNIDDQQVDDRIDEAIDYFRQYHFDGIEKMYLKHMITQDDIDNKYIVLNDLIFGVTRVFPVASGTST